MVVVEGRGGCTRGSFRQEPRRVPSRQRFSSKLCKKLFVVTMTTTWQTLFCRFVISLFGSSNSGEVVSGQESRLASREAETRRLRMCELVAGSEKPVD